MKPTMTLFGRNITLKILFRISYPNTWNNHVSNTSETSWGITDENNPLLNPLGGHWAENCKVQINVL